MKIKLFVDISCDNGLTDIIIISPDVDCLTNKKNIDDYAIVINSNTDLFSNGTFDVLNNNSELGGPLLIDT